MKVIIEIECETAGELNAHLQDIAETIMKRAKGNPTHDFEVGTHFTNNNCYGSHEVAITNE